MYCDVARFVRQNAERIAEDVKIKFDNLSRIK